MHMIAGVLQYVAVASFAEAWIEKKVTNPFNRDKRSPPSRRRGLKNTVKLLKLSVVMSPPSRRRGLKK